MIMCGGLKENGNHRLVWVCTIRKYDFVGEGISLRIWLEKVFHYVFEVSEDQVSLFSAPADPNLNS